MLTQIFLAAAVAAMVSAQAGPLDMYGLINVLYMKADKNFDGIITEQELDNVFEGFDLNKDGSVSMAEFTGLWKLLTHQSQEHAEAFFHLADLTNDDVINSSDLKLLYHVFDVDSTGTVTAKNFAAKWVQIIQETPFAVLFERADTDNNNQLTSTEFNGFFKSFDFNSDGSVDKAEFEHGWASSLFGTSADADHIFPKITSTGSIGAVQMGPLYTTYNADHDDHLTIIEVSKMAKMQPPPPSS
ncbi:probable calcium-binding protein CML18 [Pecten maximus]|uniref:probable calcium-binding protein CML18 n=1 Tax=Pecten maximus TaxID=6579 RepID=UPI0014586EB1|nr:probable calcium-binding protein CML18 [Pecten maximus]